MMKEKKKSMMLFYQEEIDMLTKKQFFIGLTLLILIAFSGGFFVGRLTKECPSVLVVKVVTDTVETYLPITGRAGSPLAVKSFPLNRKVVLPQKQIDTIRIQSNVGFASIDTIRFDSLYVAISDTGDCSGIISRYSVFGGKFKAQTITNTITKVIEKPNPLFQLNAGVQSSFIGKWQSVDIGPAIQLQLKQKFLFGYGYMIGTGSHNISIMTKIK